jgi:transcriptional regulator
MGNGMPQSKTELLKGTLDMLVLRTLKPGPLHGYGVARWIEERTRDALQIEEGSLYPALYRMARRGWIKWEWGMSDNNRRAKFYSLTAKGRKKLETEMSNWRRFALAVTLVLDENPA